MAVGRDVTMSAVRSMLDRNLDVFLSCSFSPDDAKVTNFFKALCQGLRISCVNVTGADTSVPPARARELIADCEGLIAVLTKREPLAAGDYEMPAAVREEVSIAYALGKRILIFAEAGVRLDGFMNNYATYMVFDRIALDRPETLEQALSSIRTFRARAEAELHDARRAATGEFLTSFVRGLFALRYESDRFVWFSSVTKRLEFQRPLHREITTAVWPNLRWKRPVGATPAQWGVTVNSSSRPFRAEIRADVLEADHLEGRIRFAPAPERGDFIDYTRWFRSAQLNPLFADEMPEGAPPGIVLDGVPYQVFDGVMVTEPTKALHYHCSFAGEYGLRAGELRSFVAEHPFVLESAVPSEMNRTVTEVTSFGSDIVVDLRVENPLPQLFYGLAWVLPRRPLLSTA